MTTADDKQRAYYERTALDYGIHMQPGDEHYVALEYMIGLMAVVRTSSVLDVGAGTGRAVRFIQSRAPHLQVTGIEPVPALRREAERAGTRLLDGDGRHLPFSDGEFDVVISTGLLHHVARPSTVVEEMLRVARKGIMISDANRFGQGTNLARLIKLAIHGANLWPAFDFIRTRGSGYLVSEGDGIFYSYSVFDALPQVAAWAQRTFVIPTSPTTNLRWRTASAHALLVGCREPTEGWAVMP